MWPDVGRGSEARELLGASYGGFVEGWDTPDLQEAGRLSRELEAAQSKTI